MTSKWDFDAIKTRRHKMSSELVNFIGKTNKITKTKQNNLKALAQKLGISRNTGSVYLMIDCSSSMNGKKLEQAKEGAKKFIKDAIKRGYAVGLIKFSTNAELLCEPVNTVSSLENNIENLQSGGWTYMTQAINLAHKHLVDNSGNLAIAIATDGDPQGIGESIEAALMAAARVKQENIDIIAIGTDDADEKFLSKLASRTKLAVHVPILQFGKAIASAVKLLPAS